MKNVHDMTITELIKLGYKIVVTEPPHDKEFGYFFYDGKLIGEPLGPVVWVGNDGGISNIEEGYKLLADDPEMSRPNRKSFGHHCGFDFVEDQPTATCACGAVATNPFWVTKPDYK